MKVKPLETLTLLLTVALFASVTVKLNRLNRELAAFRYPDNCPIDEVYTAIDPYLVYITSTASGRTLGSVYAEPGFERDDVAAWCDYNQIMLADVDWNP